MGSRVGIPSRLVGDDAFAASLIPRKFSTPGVNVYHVFLRPAEASSAISCWAVATACVGQSEDQKEEE